MSTTPPEGPETPDTPDTPAPPPPPGYGTPPPTPGYGTPPPNYGSTPPGGDPYGGYGTPPPPPPYAPGGSGPANQPWSVGNALSYGWDKFTKNLGPILLLSLIVLVGLIAISVVSSLVQSSVSDTGINSDGTIDSGSSFFGGLLINGLVSAVTWIVEIVLGALVVRAALDLTDGRGLDIGSIFSRIPFGPVLLLGLLNAIIVGIGIVLCVIPGLIAMFLLSYSTYFLLDRNVGAVDAMKASFNLVKNNVGAALGWAIVAFLVAFIGFCLCGVGFLATFPIAMIGTAYTYKKLTGQPVAP